MLHFHFFCDTQLCPPSLKFVKTFICFLRGLPLSSSLFCSLTNETLLLFSRVRFYPYGAKHGTVSLSASVLKGMAADTLAMCAICSCLCGDRMAPKYASFPAPSGQGRCQSPWQSPNYRRGKRRCQTAPQAQPSFACPTSVSMQKTEFHCCLAGGASVCGPRSPSEMRDRQFFGPAPRHQGTISFRCYF